MKKIFAIYFKETTDIQTHYPSETIKKLYGLNVKNSFFTAEEAETFIQNPDNRHLFDEHNEYFVLKTFIKTEEKQTIKDGF